MIAPELLVGAADLVARVGTGDACVPALRAQWPALRFLVCSEDDVPARLAPVHEGNGFNLYLIGGGEHCLALTTDADTAIGVVVATVED